MNTRYRFTSFSPAFIRETELLYHHMAEKGWLLEKTGLIFLKFKKSKPENRIYRIVLPETNHIVPFEEIPAEQAARYREEGWELLPSNASFQVLTAPEGAAPPEPYRTPQAASYLIRYLNRLRRNLVFLLIFLVLLPALIAFFFGVNHPFRRLIAGFALSFYTETGIFLFYLFLYALILLWLLREAVCGQRLKRRILTREAWSAWQPAAHRFSRGLSRFLAAAACFSLLFHAYQKQNIRSLPYREASGPFLNAEDLGLGENWLWADYDLENYEYTDTLITETSTPFMDIWRSDGTFRDGDRTTYPFLQTVYQTSDSKAARRLAALLEWNARATYHCGIFETLSTDELDLARAVLEENDREYILVKGDTVWHLSFLGPGWISQEELLKAAADKSG